MPLRATLPDVTRRRDVSAAADFAARYAPLMMLFAYFASPC